MRNEFYTHPVFQDLPVRAARLVANWVQMIFENEPEILPTDVANMIREMVFDGFDGCKGRHQYAGVALADWEALDAWVQTENYDTHFHRAVEQLGLADRDANFPKATDGQLRILKESMAEAGVDLTRLLSYFTRYEADALIKGLLVVSEVKRATGDRHFHPRDLRRAIRNYLALQGNMSEKKPRDREYKRS